VTPPYLKIGAHELPEGETHIRRMTRELTQLTDRYSAITAARFSVGKCGADAFEAHLELLLPQHQIIVNAASGTPQGAAHDVVARALAQLVQLEGRDSAIRTTMHAKAA
jgi:hypothetical protein